MCSNTTGDGNVGVGGGALRLNTTANSNTALGTNALYSSTTGSVAVAVGSSALNDMTTAANNTAVGHSAGNVTTTGAGNTYIGKTAGSVGTTGANNTMLGYLAKNSGVDVDNEIMIGVNSIAKGANTGFINANGGGNYAGNNNANWSTTSDRRIKKNIVDNNIGLEKIEKIQVKNFEYRTPEEITEVPSHAAILNKGIQLGAIAQEIEEIIPEMVKTESTGVKSIETDNLTWYLVNAVKELSEQNKKLLSRIEELEKK